MSETTTVIDGVKMTRFESVLYHLLSCKGTIRWVGTNRQDTKALNRLCKKGAVERYPDPLPGHPQNYSWRIRT